MVLHAFDPSRKISEVKAHMFYRASSRTGYATWRNPFWGGKSGGKESYRNRLHKTFLEYRHIHILKRVKRSYLITK